MGRHGVRHLIAGIMAVAMTVSLAGCSQAVDRTDGAQEAVDMGTVRIFVPSDGVTVSQETPVNKWGSFSQSLVSRLKDVGFASRDVKSSTSDDAADQAKAVADYVDSIADDTRRHIIVVAPYASVDAATKRYGDLIDDADGSDSTDASAQSTGTSSSDSSKSSDSSNGKASSSQGTASGETTDETTDDASASTDAADADALASALGLAKQRGIRVVLMRCQLAGFIPDVFVKTSSAYDIGVLQATEMVSKLKVDAATVDNPRRIEVLIPIGGDDTVGREAFRGIWSVLGKYFRNGKAVSPSGRIDESSDEDSWGKVAFRADDGTAVDKELKARLGLDKSSKKGVTRVDGVLAMNDFAAYEVDKTLADAGYVGSSADINPEITLGGIVNNITGNEDLQRNKVPEPARSSGSSGSSADGDGGQDDSGSDSGTGSASGTGADSGADGDDTQTGKTQDTQWPIITGFGSYVSNVPLIVNGKQWMTGLEDRERLASDIAKVCGTYGTGQDDLIGQGRTAGFDGDDGDAITLGSVDVDGAKVPAVSRPLVAVTGSNLKKTVLDPGYVSAADAGL